MSEIAIRVFDVEDALTILRSCLNYFQLTDLSNAQVNLTEVRYRPLTQEVARIKERLENYRNDYILEKVESGEISLDELQEPQSSLQELVEASEREVEEVEVLPDLPVMKPPVRKSRGARTVKSVPKEDV